MTTTNNVPTQTFSFDRELKNKFFSNGESYWDYHKEAIMKSFEICDEYSDDDFEVIIRPKNIKENEYRKI